MINASVHRSFAVCDLDSYVWIWTMIHISTRHLKKKILPSWYIHIRTYKKTKQHATPNRYNLHGGGNVKHNRRFGGGGSERTHLGLKRRVRHSTLPLDHPNQTDPDVAATTLTTRPCSYKARTNTHTPKVNFILGLLHVFCSDFWESIICIPASCVTSRSNTAHHGCPFTA